MENNGALFMMALTAGYFLPAFVANFRGTFNRGSVTVINIFLGWTFIGWVIALAMSCSSMTVDDSNDHGN